MGEGAGMAVLESEAHARARGARIYAELAGYGSSMDGYQLTAPQPQGEGAARAMRAALADAGLAPADIDYINAHGTGTRLNDPAETSAIKAVFGAGAGRVAVSSSKSLIGHLLAACGGPEFVFTALSVHRDAIHPTANLTQPDPKCDLDYVPGRPGTGRCGRRCPTRSGSAARTAAWCCAAWTMPRADKRLPHRRTERPCTSI